MLQKDIDRFWSKIIFPKELDLCWEFNGFHDRDGYAMFWYNNSRIGAHRFSYIIHNAFNFNIDQVLHTCDNPGCVNPKHLFTGTNRDNMIDRDLKNRNVKGSKVNTSILTEEDIIKMLNGISNGVYSSIEDMCIDFKIISDTVYKILYGHNWKHITCNYDLNRLLGKVRHKWLTTSQKQEIKNQAKLGVKIVDISKRFNRHPTQIRRIINIG